MPPTIAPELIKTFHKSLLSSSPSQISHILSLLPPVDLSTLRTPSDQTPLHLVVSHHPNPPSIIPLLHNHPINIRGHFTQNVTPLHQAVQNVDVETVELLVAAGARVNMVKRGDWTPLMIACASKKHGNACAVVRLLLSVGASVDAVNRFGESVVHLAARTCPECLNAVWGSGVELCTRNGRNALHYAARAGNVECVKLLLGYNVDLVTGDNGGMNPVHEACVSNSARSVEVLRVLDRRDLLLKMDLGGLNGVHHAAIAGNVYAFEYIVGMEECKEVRDGRGMTPVALAMCHGQMDVVWLLLGWGVSVKEEWVIMASRLGKKEVVDQVRRWLQMENNCCQ